MIAVSIKDGWARFAQVDLGGKTHLLNQIGELSLPNSLKDPDLRSERLPSLLGDLFRKINDTLKNSDRDVYISLGDGWVETDLVEVDVGLNREEKESYLDWVMGQRLGSLLEDSDVFYSLPPDQRDTVDQIVLSVTPRQVIQAVQSAIQDIGAIPVWMEAAVFSLSRISGFLDEGRTTRTVAMEPVGTGFRGLFHHKGQLRALARFALRNGRARESVAKGDKTLVEESLKDFNAYLSGEDMSPDLHVFLSGETSRQTLKLLTHGRKTKGVVTVIDPFSGLATDGVSLPDTGNGSWYVDVRGLIEKGT